jgi:hypothetical protein
MDTTGKKRKGMNETTPDLFKTQYEINEKENIGVLPDDQQVMNKVLYHIFYNGDATLEKVDIQGDFTGWKRIPMREVEDANGPQGATHLFKKLMNPQVYYFNFVIDGQVALSDNYDIVADKNCIDLSESPTCIFKKKNNYTGSTKLKSLISPIDGGSQYETLSKFIENEEIKMNMAISETESENYEDFKQEKLNQNLKT